MRTADAEPVLAELLFRLQIPSRPVEGSQHRRVRQVSIGDKTILFFTGAGKNSQIIVKDSQENRGITQDDLNQIEVLIETRKVETVTRKMIELGVPSVRTEAILPPNTTRKLSGPIVLRSFPLNPETTVNMATPWGPYSKYSAVNITDTWISQTGQKDRPVTDTEAIRFRQIRPVQKNA